MVISRCIRECESEGQPNAALATRLEPRSQRADQMGLTGASRRVDADITHFSIFDT